MPDLKTGDLKTDGGELPTAAASGLPGDGLVVVEPYIHKILDGSKTMLVKSRKLKIGGEFLLITRSKAYGIIKLSAPKSIGVKEFKALEKQHLITAKTRKKFWPVGKAWWAYKIMSLKVFAKPLPIQATKGKEIIIKDVRFTKDVSIHMFELEKADADVLANFGAWLRVLSARASRWSEATLELVTGPKGVVELIRGFPVNVKRMAEMMPGSSGEADEKEKLPTSLRETTSWGLKAEKALRDADQIALADKVKDLLKEMQNVTDLLPRLTDAENEPIVKTE